MVTGGEKFIKIIPATCTTLDNNASMHNHSQSLTYQTPIFSQTLHLHLKSDPDIPLKQEQPMSLLLLVFAIIKNTQLPFHDLLPFSSI